MRVVAIIAVAVVRVVAMIAVENVACQLTSINYDNRSDIFMVDIFYLAIN